VRRPLSIAPALLALGAALATPGAAAAREWHGMTIRPLDPPRGAADARAAAAPTPPARRRDAVLSDERTFTRSAYSLARFAIRARPLAGAHRVGRVRLWTEDGFPEVYLALRSHWDHGGQEWVRIRIPGRPNGRTGWVRREALGRFRLTDLLVIVDRRRLRIVLRRDGRKVWSAPVGVGAPGTPTPRGRFWIRERFRIADPRSGYYPYAFGTAAYSVLTDWPGGGIVGIHGPYYAASAIPGRISHGCIRLRVRDDRWLARHIRVGVPLRIR
jgi:L,D-transpeptidase catalytic domain